MSATASPNVPAVIHYPDDDGLPMSDNTWQFNWIVLIHSNLDVQYRSDPNVFVAGNHLIYAVEGKVTIRQAPDVYVAFGRPKADRGSYKVWEEGGLFPQVVFEVWSPHNRQQEMEDKRDFYEEYGAEEYYIVYPEFPSYAEGWRREGGKFVRIADMNGFVSPRLGMRFILASGELTLIGRDGRPFRTATEMARERDEAERESTQEKERAAKLAAKLRELGVDPDKV